MLIFSNLFDERKHSPSSSECVSEYPVDHSGHLRFVQVSERITEYIMPIDKECEKLHRNDWKVWADHTRAFIQPSAHLHRSEVGSKLFQQANDPGFILRAFLHWTPIWHQFFCAQSHIAGGGYFIWEVPRACWYIQEPILTYLTLCLPSAKSSQFRIVSILCSR